MTRAMVHACLCAENKIGVLYAVCFGEATLLRGAEQEAPLARCQRSLACHKSTHAMALQHKMRAHFPPTIRRRVEGRSASDICRHEL